MAVPRYMESLIVSMVDNYEAEHEFFGPLRKKLEQQKEIVNWHAIPSKTRKKV